MKKILLVFCYSLLIISYSLNAHAASVVATVDGNPVTDSDVTSRVKLMTMQGQKSTNNRIIALSNIIDDYVKISYAGKFRAAPSDADVEKELKKLENHFGGFDAVTRATARGAIRAQIAWQIIIGRTIMPTIKVTDDDIAAEKRDLEQTRGLPIDITFIRLIDIPADIATKLTKPSSCDNAMKIAEDLGGAPQKLTAAEYELSADVRVRVVGLPILQWSAWVDSSVLLVCSKKKNAEYKDLDNIIKQNATYKRATFRADQQLKQLRRKTVVIINDPVYKSALD